jgi:hypothetical protein
MQRHTFFPVFVLLFFVTALFPRVTHAGGVASFISNIISTSVSVVSTTINVLGTLGAISISSTICTSQDVMYYVGIRSNGCNGGSNSGGVSGSSSSPLSCFTVGGGANNGNEQTAEANTISAVLTSNGYNGGVTGSSNYRNSAYHFSATKGAYFTLSGANLGSNITIVHRQDFSGISNNLCANRGNIPPEGYFYDSDCTYNETWSQSNRTLCIYSPGGQSGPASGGVPTVAVSASPNPVQYNTPTTLTWTSTGATSCTALSGNWSNTSPSSGNSLNGSTLTAPLIAATTFTLQCSGPGGTSPVQSVTTTVAAPLCPNGANNPLQCNQCPATLAFIGGACVACTGGCTSPGAGGAGGSGGSGGNGGNATNPLGAPPMTCNNGRVNPPACDVLAPTVTLTANPSTIDTGSPTKLTWSSTNATSCTSLNGGTGEGSFSTNSDANNSVGVNVGPLTSSKNYQIYCDGPGGRVTSNTVPVTVLQPTLGITANPLRLTTGSSSKLTWNASDVTGCAVTGSNGFSNMGTSGIAVDTGPITAQTIFTLTCDVIGPSISRSVTVNILPIFQPF